MSIETVCSSCSVRIKVKDELIGKAVKCPRCGQPIAVSASLVTADRQPSTAPRADDTVDLPKGSPSADGRTSSIQQGQEAQPKDTLPAASSAAGLPNVPGYRVQREIARGGMGRVLAAHDLSLDRDVALKILLPGSSADRFVRESRITARLPHPGIPPVHALGTLADGSPFLAMKLIVGKTLAVEIKASTLTPFPSPSGRGERGEGARPRLLQAFLQVCQAVGFAHSRGVIHRDLKPGNIMVGAFGEVQVMDWGLAKDLTGREVSDQPDASAAPVRPLASQGTDADQTVDYRVPGESTDDRTRAGEVLGTPAFMAPEQARGEAVDARADVFALGGILCAILTGKPPFHGSSSLEVLQRAGAADLAEALMRLNGCGADAELIDLTKTCLGAKADDRPKDGQAVAAALAAYFETVEQRLHLSRLAEAEARARAAEERKRRRLTLVLAATVLLALTLGGGGWLWIRADREARQMQATRDVNEALTRATTFLDQARKAKTGGAELLAQARDQTQRARALADNGQVDETLKAQIRQVQGELDDLKEAEEQARQRGAQEEKDHTFVAALDAARLDQTEGMVDANRFAMERALPKFRDAFEAYGMSVGEGEPAATAERIRQRPAPVREAVVAALDEWILLVTDPKYHTKEPHREWLLAVAAAAEPEDSWTQRFRTARKEKDQAGRRAALEKMAAEATPGILSGKLPASSLARLARSLLDEQAEAGALRLLRQAQAQYPEDFWVNYYLGQALHQVRPPQWEEAVRFFMVAAALRKESAGAHSALGMALARNGELDEAVASHRKAIALNPKLALAHNSLGLALGMQNKVDEAVASLRTAIDLEPKLALAHLNLGLVLAGTGKADDGIARCRQAVLLEPKLSYTHAALGAALLAKGKLDEAITSYRKAIALDPKVAGAHSGLGDALRDKGRPDEAIDCYRRAIALDPTHVTSQTHLGLILARNEKRDEAIVALRQAVARAPKQVKYAEVYTVLGAALGDKGQVDEAIDCFRHAVACNPKYAVAHASLGLNLAAKEKFDEAIVSYRTAIALDPKDNMAQNGLVAALVAAGQADEAVAYSRKAALAAPKDAHAHARLGDALLGKWKMDDAVDCYRQALVLDPKLVRAHTNLGFSLSVKGQADEAILCLREALTLAPKDVDANFWMSVALIRKGGKYINDATYYFVQAEGLDKQRAKELSKKSKLFTDHFRAMKKAEPREQARLGAAQGDWSAAAAGYALHLNKQPLADGEVGFEYAAVLLLSGDQTGYRKLCADLLERGGQKGVRSYHVARTCTLAPDSVKDNLLPGKKADNELKGARGAFWSLTEQGALAYRAGRFDEAQALLTQSLQADSKPGNAVVNWLWLSLVEERRGKPAEARAWLAKATKWFEQYPRGVDGAKDVHLHNWLEAQVLRREAEALLVPKR